MFSAKHQRVVCVKYKSSLCSLLIYIQWTAMCWKIKAYNFTHGGLLSPFVGSLGAIIQVTFLDCLVSFLLFMEPNTYISLSPKPLHHSSRGALLKKMTLKRRRHASETSVLKAFWPWELNPMTSTGNDPSFEGLWFNFRGKCLWNFPMPFFRGNCLSKFPNDLLKCIASVNHCQNASRQFVSEACLLSLGVILAPGCPRPPREGISNWLWYY